jgi:hypothetical protein
MVRFPEGGPQPPEQKISLEHWINTELASQYRTEANFLRSAGLLEVLPHSRSMGLLDITGHERALPSPEAIAQELRGHKEIYEGKINQGFRGMEFTPFGSPLAKLEALVKKLLVKLHNEKRLFGTDYDQQGQTKEVSLDLDTNQPLYVWDQLEKADETGALVYYPKQFTKENHGGKTKTEILETTELFPGWSVSLVENSTAIPRAGKGKMVGGRKQLEAGISSNDYLKKLQTDPTYAHESGQTPEDELTRLIRSLLKNGHVIHDYQNNVDSLNYLLGAWVTASGVVPFGRWYRDSRQASLGWDVPGYVVGYCGAGSAVRIGGLKV